MQSAKTLTVTTRIWIAGRSTFLDAQYYNFNYVLNVHKVGLNSTRFLFDRVRVLLLNEFLY
jgi:hypothetical protein